MTTGMDVGDVIHQMMRMRELSGDELGYARGVLRRLGFGNFDTCLLTACEMFCCYSDVVLASCFWLG